MFSRASLIMFLAEKVVPKAQTPRGQPVQCLLNYLQKSQDRECNRRSSRTGLNRVRDSMKRHEYRPAARAV